MSDVKYIKTKKNEIIIFSGLQTHAEFSSFEPVSAGFIQFFIDEDKNPSCQCYGKSVSLGIESDPKDSKIAQVQIMGLHGIF